MESWMGPIALLFVLYLGIMTPVNGQISMSASFIMPLKDQCQNVWWKGFTHRYVESSSLATYENDMECDISIVIPGVGEIAIHFLYFAVEDPVNGHCNDFLQFFYDHQMTRPITAQLCGSSLPDDLVVSSDRFTFYFTSNERIHDGGFRFNFTALSAEGGAKWVPGGTVPGTIPGNGTTGGGKSIHGLCGANIISIVVIIMTCWGNGVY